MILVKHVGELKPNTDVFLVTNVDELTYLRLLCFKFHMWVSHIYNFCVSSTICG